MKDSNGCPKINFFYFGNHMQNEKTLSLHIGAESDEINFWNTRFMILETVTGFCKERIGRNKTS